MRRALIAFTALALAWAGGAAARPRHHHKGYWHIHPGGVRHWHAYTSYYGAPGEKGLNKHTANGEVFRPRGYTAAHRTLPFGTKLRVHRGARYVDVRVNDRGPAEWTGRDLDLSYGAAQVLGIIPQGVEHVEAEILAPVFVPIFKGIDDAIQGRP